MKYTSFPPSASLFQPKPKQHSPTPNWTIYHRKHTNHFELCAYAFTQIIHPNDYSTRPSPPQPLILLQLCRFPFSTSSAPDIFAAAFSTDCISGLVPASRYSARALGDGKGEERGITVIMKPRDAVGVGGGGCWWWLHLQCTAGGPRVGESRW
jgi:hypothetical protein